jgi:RNA polymerase sigma-70 factor (ECF subfamily)
MRRYSPRIFAIASRFFRQRERVEDAAQEVFLKAYTQLASYKGEGSFEGWLSRIATNTCINVLRSAKRRQEYTMTDLSDSDGEYLEGSLRNTAGAGERTVEQRLVAADLAEKLLERLPPDDRAVLMFMEGDDLSVKEISEMTGWSESKVKVKAMRARRKMRQAVEKLLGRNLNPESMG